MRELLNNICLHKNNNDTNICYLLFNYIYDHKINSLEELQKKEDEYFNTNDIKKRLDECYNNFLMDYTHLEELNQNDMAKLLSYSELYKKSDDIDIKTKCIVYMYDILEWSFLLPYQTYKLIMQDMFK